MTNFTTAGALLIKHSLPTERVRESFDLHKPLDKKAIGNLVNNLAVHGGPQAHEHINDLGKMFFHKATEIGATTPISDYINESHEREVIIQEFDSKVKEIMAKTNLTAAQRNDLLSNLTGKYNTKIEKQNLDYLLSQGSTAAKMALTGARGNPSQLAVGTSTPLMSPNMRGEIVPIVIKSSYSKGMTPAEQLAMSYMGRGSTVLSQLSTALPGALFKRIAPTVFHEVITEDDCKTHNGIEFPVEDKKAILGRYEAGSNHLIDEAYYKELSHSKKNVRVRSTKTCEAKQGVCKRCYGLMGSGKPAEIGENVGVIAAQSVSEVLTQAMLGTKHKASVGERKGNAYEQAANLLNNPDQNFKDEATISLHNGVISDIRKTPLGDYQVYVNEHMHFVPQTQALKVDKGNQVRKGDPLSTGTINPRKLVSLRGLGAGRQYMSKELREIYGGGLDPRHFEILSKNLLKYVEVQDPGETGFLPGQKVDINTIHKYLDDHRKVVPVHEADGKLLAKPVHELTVGTMLDANHIHDLKQRGIKEVAVSNSGLKVNPIVPGLQTAKLLDRNWVSKLSFQRLKDVLTESAVEGADSHVHDVDPITPYILGHEFGEGGGGKY